jgi:hypothetical protein
MRTSVVLVAIMAFFWTLSALGQEAELKPLPDVGKGQREKIAPQPAKPMYIYRDGQRTEMIQDLTFIVFRFADPASNRDARHKFYEKIRLVVSELRELALVTEGYYVIRLMPGASEEQWNIFAARLKQDQTLSYVGRVFKVTSSEGLIDLWVSTPSLSVTFKGPASKDMISRLEGQYPLVVDPKQPDAGKTLFRLRDERLDPVELSNNLYETGQFAGVEPHFIIVTGQPVTDDVAQSVMKGAIEAMPEEVRKEKMKRLQDARRKQQQRMEQEQSSQPDPQWDQAQ